jgi:uncharacterized protein (DUF1684 family)
MTRTSLFVLAAILGVATVHAADIDPYQRSVEQWRADRLARLTAPNGWLSLTGLEWLKPGGNRIGSASDNDIVLPSAPAHLGTLDLGKDGTLHLVLADGSGASVDGKAVHAATLVDDMHASDQTPPTTVAFGTSDFYVIDRDGRKALRVKDSQAPTRRHFAGLDYFPIDPDWRIVAEWVPFAPPQKLQIGSVIGTIDNVDVPGKAVFQRDGHTYELLPYQEEPGGELFFVMADRTSGKETYGASRFLYAALPKDGLARPGTVVLDFNQLYNPPCAFTPFATCPLAPPENRLDLRVTAGEKKYSGGHD